MLLHDTALRQAPVFRADLGLLRVFWGVIATKDVGVNE
jgi:hypothetical protein